MKKFLIFSLVALSIFPSMFLLSGCKDKTVKSSASYGDLPIVRINTQDNRKPRDKENYVNCSFELTNCEDDSQNVKVSMKSSYDNKEDDGGVGVRLRGNSTMAFDKKPYRIKFAKKTSLFGLKKAKSWVLLADYLDQSNIRNYTAMTLGNSVFDNLDFTATPHHVILEFNGEYKGVYLLCEQMDEKKGRANVEVEDEELFSNYEKTEFPFFIEMDSSIQDGTVSSADRLELYGYYPIEIKYPEAEDRLELQQNAENLGGGVDLIRDYITEYLNAVKTTLSTGEKVTVSFRNDPVGFEDLVDVDSLIDFNLLNEFMYNPDSVWKSFYMHKSVNKVDETTGEIVEYGKLKFGPVWDFDWSMSGTYTGDPYTESFIDCARKITVFNRSVIFTDFLKNEEYYARVQARWQEVTTTRTGKKQLTVKQVCDKLRDYKSHIAEASKFDAIVYYGLTGDYEFDLSYDYVRLFMLDRIDYFDEIFALSHTDFLLETGIISA